MLSKRRPYEIVAFAPVADSLEFEASENDSECRPARIECLNDRIGGRYPSDMTDGEWARLETLTPPANPADVRARPTSARLSTPFSICCKPAACGVIFPATDFRWDRASMQKHAWPPRRGFLLAPRTTHVSDDMVS